MALYMRSIYRIQCSPLRYENGGYVLPSSNATDDPTGTKYIPLLSFLPFVSLYA